MTPEKTAELTTQIVSSELQSGTFIAKDAKAVCEYYSAIHAQVLACSKEANDFAQTSFSGQVIEPLENSW